MIKNILLVGTEYQENIQKSFNTIVMKCLLTPIQLISIHSTPKLIDLENYINLLITEMVKNSNISITYKYQLTQEMNLPFDYNIASVYSNDLDFVRVMSLNLRLYIDFDNNKYSHKLIDDLISKEINDYNDLMEKILNTNITNFRSYSLPHTKFLTEKDEVNDEN